MLCLPVFYQEWNVLDHCPYGNRWVVSSKVASKDHYLCASRWRPKQWRHMRQVGPLQCKIIRGASLLVSKVTAHIILVTGWKYWSPFWYYIVITWMPPTKNNVFLSVLADIFMLNGVQWHRISNLLVRLRMKPVRLHRVAHLHKNAMTNDLTRHISVCLCKDSLC